MSLSVSVKTFEDADAIYAHVNASEIMPFFSVTEADIKPGITFLSKNPLVDGIKWGMYLAQSLWDRTLSQSNESHPVKRSIKERKSNGETLWMSRSIDGMLTKYTTTHCVDGDNLSLAAYLPKKNDSEMDFTPAKIKYAKISTFRERVLSDAEDVARGLSMNIQSLLLEIALNLPVDKRNIGLGVAPEFLSPGKWHVFTSLLMPIQEH